jgi:predicted phage terminase large subunit-like protein
MAFLLADETRECLYGGAAGGGKTDALLMAALQYVHVPGYAALVLMRSYADLTLPKAAMSRAREWLGGTTARPIDGGREWRFPSGASLTFGYLDHAGDEQRYRTAEFQFVAFDELTRFPEHQYTFLFSRLRKTIGDPKTCSMHDVPLRMRAATNPGDKYGEWVKKRFIPDEYLREKGEARFGRVWWKGSRLFVPARLQDNPTLDADDYRKNLAELLPVVRAQMEHGDWGAHEFGHFRPEWWRRYEEFSDAWYVTHTREQVKHGKAQIIAAVDPAGGVSDSADYTAIVVVAVTPGGSLLVIDVVRERIPVERVVARIAEVCKRHRPSYIAIEDCFAQSAYIRQARATPGVPTVRAIDPGGQSKLVRATPAILRAEQGGIVLPRYATWLDDFTAECQSFTGDDKLDAHDDQVDALAYCVLCHDRYRGASNDGPVTLGRRGQ